MNKLPISGLPMIEAEEADPEVAQLYSEIQQETELSYVPNSNKGIAVSPGILTIYRDLMITMNRNIIIPQSLVSMILYCIATAKNCTYCSAINELFCRTLGVDDATLEMLANDLGNVSPTRLKTIIQFALQCALHPQELVAEDYDHVRNQGISDEEIVQIIFLAALGNFYDTMADSLKIETDSMVLTALGR